MVSSRRTQHAAGGPADGGDGIARGGARATSSTTDSAQARATRAKRREREAGHQGRDAREQQQRPADEEGGGVGGATDVADEAAAGVRAARGADAAAAAVESDRAADIDPGHKKKRAKPASKAKRGDVAGSRAAVGAATAAAPAAADDTAPQAHPSSGCTAGLLSSVGARGAAGETGARAAQTAPPQRVQRQDQPLGWQYGLHQPPAEGMGSMAQPVPAMEIGWRAPLMAQPLTAGMPHTAGMPPPGSMPHQALPAGAVLPQQPWQQPWQQPPVLAGGSRAAAQSGSPAPAASSAPAVKTKRNWDKPPREKEEPHSLSLDTEEWKTETIRMLTKLAELQLVDVLINYDVSQAADGRTTKIAPTTAAAKKECAARRHTALEGLYRALLEDGKWDPLRTAEAIGQRLEILKKPQSTGSGYSAAKEAYDRLRIRVNAGGMAPGVAGTGRKKTAVSARAHEAAPGAEMNFEHAEHEHFEQQDEALQELSPSQRRARAHLGPVIRAAAQAAGMPPGAAGARGGADTVPNSAGGMELVDGVEPAETAVGPSDPRTLASTPAFMDFLRRGAEPLKKLAEALAAYAEGADAPDLDENELARAWEAFEEHTSSTVVAAKRGGKQRKSGAAAGAAEGLDARAARAAATGQRPGQTRGAGATDGLLGVARELCASMEGMRGALQAAEDRDAARRDEREGVGPLVVDEKRLAELARSVPGYSFNPELSSREQLDGISRAILEAKGAACMKEAMVTLGFADRRRDGQSQAERLQQLEKVWVELTKPQSDEESDMLM